MEQIVPQPRLVECGARASLCHGRLLVLRNGTGWIRPLQDIDHPAAKWNRGNVYLDVHDVRPNVKLHPGDLVVFHLYVDKKGLGAEDCFSVQDPCGQVFEGSDSALANDEAFWSTDQGTLRNNDSSQNWAKYQCESELQHAQLATAAGAVAAVSDTVPSPLELLNLYEDDSDSEDDFYGPSHEKVSDTVASPLDLLDFYEDDSDTDDDFYGPSNAKAPFCMKDSPRKSKEDCSTSEGEGEDALVSTGISSEGSDDESLSDAEHFEEKPFRYPPGLPHLPGPVYTLGQEKPELVKSSFCHPPGLPLVPGLVSPGTRLPASVPEPPGVPLKPGLVSLSKEMMPNSSSDIGGIESSNLAADKSVKQFRFPPGLPHPPGQLASTA